MLSCILGTIKKIVAIDVCAENNFWKGKHVLILPVRLEVNMSICSVMKQLDFKSGDFNEGRRDCCSINNFWVVCYLLHEYSGKDLKSWIFVDRDYKSAIFQSKLCYVIF